MSKSKMKSEAKTSESMTTTTNKTISMNTMKKESVQQDFPTKEREHAELVIKTNVKDRRAYKNYIEIENNNRQAFKGIESLLSSLGQAVGLGNIWRFPSIAYSNGGSSFLIPYIICIFVFAIPAIHIECALGQYAAKSPPAVFRRMMPALEGIGWMTCLVGATIGVYYMILISWIFIYLFNATSALKMSRCDNYWNTNKSTLCYEGILQKKCRDEIYNATEFPMMGETGKVMFINGECRSVDELTMKNNITIATRQFFTNFVISPSSGFTDISSINWPTFGGLAFCWIITSAILIRGMKTIGKLSYCTVILPYGIIIILMIRGITLDGAGNGLYYLWWKSDFSAIYQYGTWSAALTQMCFSLSIGQGGLMNIASYNKKTYNWYRDAYIIVLCDTMMSLIGGTAVFSTLGFLAKQREIEVPEVIKRGPDVAFVVYTEAISQMPIPFLWYGLFFVMLLLLGISTEIVIVEIVCSCLADRFSLLRKHRWITVLCVCLTFFGLGLIMTTDAGYYWFDMFDEYSAGVTATFGAALTCVCVCWFYGLDYFREDMTEMWGEPTSWWGRHLGPASYIWTLVWKFVTPVCCLVVMSFFVYDRKYPFKGKPVEYPPAFDILGWIVAAFPFFVIPIYAVTAILNAKNQGIPIRAAFMVQKQHPAYDRIYETWPEWKKLIADQMPEQEPGDDDVEMVDGMEDHQDDSFIE